jgi:conserved repeat domain
MSKGLKSTNKKGFFLLVLKNVVLEQKYACDSVIKISNIFLYVVLLVLGTGKGFAEGTKEVSPNSPNLTGLFIGQSVNYGPYLNCPQDNRIYFRINDYTKERFYYGFMFTNYSNYGWGINSTADMYIRIYNPDGSLASGPLQLYANTNNLTQGYISNYAQAIAGPNGLDGVSSGYNAQTFTPTKNGEYWVEIYQSWDGGSNAYTDWRNAPFWDMGVYRNASSKKISGRVHSDKWGFTATDGNNYSIGAGSVTEASSYCYTDDQVVLKLSFTTGMSPMAYALSMNNYGVTNTGNWLNDRKSITNGSTSPSLANGFPVFLNVPDPTCYPVCGSSAVPSLPNPAILKRGSNYLLKFNAPQAGDYIILFDFDKNDGAYTAGSADRWVEKPDQAAGISTYSWDGKDGLGNVIPPSQMVNLIIFFRKGRVNIPLYDVELNLGGLRIDAVSPDNVSNARLYWDDSGLTTYFSSSDPNNNNSTVAGWNNSITGSVSPAHAWNGNGNPSQTIPAPADGAGSITPNTFSDDYGNVRTINTWAWGVELKAPLSTQLLTVNLSGTVWHDSNNSANGKFTNIYTSGESGTTIGSALYVTLIDPHDNTVIRSVAVNSDGTYTLPEIPRNANNLELRITSVQGTEDATPPAIYVLSGWVNTTPLTRTVSIGTSDVTGIDFGVNQKPVAAGSTNAITPIPVGTNTTSVASYFGGIDASKGYISSLKITAFPTNVTSLSINGTSYTSTSFPAAGVSVPTNAAGVPTQSILVDPVGDVAVTVTIPFVVIDDGGAQSDNIANVVLNYVPQSDVSVSKVMNNTKPFVGSDVLFTITATNNGPNGVTNVRVTDNIPSGYTLVNVSAPLGTSWSSPIWTIGSLTSGTSVVLTIEAKVNVEGDYSNTALVTANEADPVPDNNSSIVTSTPIPVADLKVVKTIDNPSPKVGETVYFTITASNSGPSDATGVVVADQLPAGYTYVSSNSVNYNSSTGAWAIGGLANGASKSLTITATINAAGNYTNVATINGNEADPNPTDPGGVITPTVVPVTDLTISKTVDKLNPLVGDEVTFTIVAGNKGPSDATGVTVTDALPKGYSFVSAFPSSGVVVNNGVITWTIGNLVNGNSASLEVKARVQ